MAITDKKTGVWGLDQTYNKINQGSIWSFYGQVGLWRAGTNAWGSLGLNQAPGVLNSYSSPVQIPGATWSRDLGKFATTPPTNYSMFAIKTDGTLYSWGKNTEGMLGLNDKTDRSSPTQIPGTTWKTVSAAYQMHSAIKTDGTLWTWGQSGDGALGHNKGGAGWQGNTPLSSPKQVPGTTWSWGVIDKAALFTKTDGTLWSWGYNQQGGLGQNNTTRYSSPVQIPGTTWQGDPGKLAVSQGGNAMLAIRTDGTLWAWGGGGAGQLAQNSRTEYSSPIQIGSETTWRYLMSSGFSNFMATKTDGTLWAWGGQADYGQLGQGDTNARSSPIQIPGTTWHVPHGGPLFNLCTKTDGTLWATGSPQYASIGLNQGYTGANPSKTTVQCGGDGWIEAKMNFYGIMGTRQT